MGTVSYISSHCSLYTNRDTVSFEYKISNRFRLRDAFRMSIDDVNGPLKNQARSAMCWIRIPANDEFHAYYPLCVSGVVIDLSVAH